MNDDVKKEFMEKTIQNCKEKFGKIEHLTSKIIDNRVSRTDKYAIIARVNKMASTMERDLESFFGSKGKENEQL